MAENVPERMSQAQLAPTRIILSYQAFAQPDRPEDFDEMNPAGDGDLTLSAGPVQAVRCPIEAGEHQLGNDDLEVYYSWDGEVISLAIETHKALTLDTVTVDFAHTFTSDERILLNGYQSWTDTCELAPDAKMCGLRGVPAAIVRKYVLDGGGDYRFVDYSSEKGVLHGFTYATIRHDDRVTLLGSLDESNGFSIIHANTRANRVWVEKEPPACTISAGERLDLCHLAVVCGAAVPGAAITSNVSNASTVSVASKADGAKAASSAIAMAYNRWFDLMGVQPRPARPLVGYTSWYRHYDNIDETALLHDLDGTTQVLNGLGDLVLGPDSHLAALFQIDDGYMCVGDWLDPDTEKFPKGMAPVAAAIRDHGLVPGVWVAPFVCSRNSRLFAKHPDWLLRDELGNPVMTGSHWSGAYALDTRNSAVREYVTHVLQTMTSRETDNGGWGFDLLKCDFLYAACMLPHDGLNRGQLMADAVDLIRGAIGDDVAILACGVPLGSVFGKVEYCRIGCDVGLDWDDKPHMRHLHRERVSTKNSLANTVGRAPLDERAFASDPDVFFLRGDVKLTAQQRTKLARADSLLSSVLLTSDDMGAWGQSELDEYKRLVATFADRARAQHHTHEYGHAHGCDCEDCQDCQQATEMDGHDE